MVSEMQWIAQCRQEKHQVSGVGVPQARSDRGGPGGTEVNRKETWHFTREEPRASSQQTINQHLCQHLPTTNNVKDLILLILILILILIMQHVKTKTYFNPKLATNQQTLKSSSISWWYTWLNSFQYSTT